MSHHQLGVNIQTKDTLTRFERKDPKDGSANGSAIGYDKGPKVRKIANEQGKECEQSYNVNFS